MHELIQILFSALTLLGIGGILGGYITYILDRKKKRDFDILSQKEKRYKSCLLFMDSLIESRSIKYISRLYPDIADTKDVIEWLKMEYYEMMLYASEEVISSIKAFIEKPTKEIFLQTILIMREDLSKKKSVLNLSEVKLKLDL